MRGVVEKVLGWVAAIAVVVLGVAFVLPVLAIVFVVLLGIGLIAAAIFVIAFAPLATYITVADKRETKSNAPNNIDIIDVDYVDYVVVDDTDNDIVDE